MNKKQTASKQQELDQKYIDNIKNYEDQFQTLSSFEHIRKRPGMHIGYKGTLGFLRIIREILQNAIDEKARKDSPCDNIRVSFFEDSQTCIVEDNGRGIPFSILETAFTTVNMSTNYTKKLFDYTSGTNGVGAKVANALAKKFVVESYVLGEAKCIECEEGNLIKGPYDIDTKGKYNGTIVLLQPSNIVLGETDLTAQELLDMIELILPVSEMGTRIEFSAILKSGKTIKDTIVNEDGIISLMYKCCKKPIFKPIGAAIDNGTMKTEFLLTWDIMPEDMPELLYSFSNFCPTNSSKSSHTAGFIAGLKKFFVDYMNKTYLASSGNSKKQNQLRVIESDIRYGMRAVVNSAHLEPFFTGQAKDELYMPEMTPFVEELTYNALNEWSKTNTSDLQKLCKYFKEVATMRLSTEKKKVNLQQQFNATKEGLPSKFVAPTKFGKFQTHEAAIAAGYKFDCYIVEGDSAGGSVETNRDNERQGVFPIRGMLPDCFKKDIKALLANPEISGILTIIGGGYNGPGSKFDINKVKWDKIIIGSDADSAGAFISCLVTRLCIRFCPELITSGRLYRAIPPLYYLKKGKKKEYFTDRRQLVDYIQKSFSKDNEISTMGGKVLSKKEVEDLLYINIDYIYELEKISNRYRILPKILEIFLTYRKEPYEKICKYITKEYRFMKHSIINGLNVCDGVANQKSTTLIMNDRLLHESEAIIKIINNNLYTEYLLNGQKATILDIMTKYKNYEPKDLYRLKGLGEQDAEELAESLIYPGDMGNRVLQQITMSSAMKEIEEIRAIESNKNRLLEDIIVTRLDITD